MMWRLWLRVGRLTYWVAWPLLYVYLHGSKRTRVLVVHGDEVLVVRGWLGSGRWLLPGGGLHRHERPAEGASRELEEETGLAVNATELQPLISDEPIQQSSLSFRLYAFAVKLDKKPQLRRQRFEITQLAWMNWRTLRTEQSRDADVRRVLDAFFQE